MPEFKLDSHHRSTIERLFAHPTSHNIHWRDVRSLLEAVGTVHEEHGGRVKVTLGGETEAFRPPRHGEIDAQMVVDLRRMLRGAGVAPD